MRLPALWGRERDDPFAALHREVERVFDDFTKGWPSVAGLQGNGRLVPSIGVHETDGGLVVSAELPGVDEKDVEVTLADNLLTIKGEKKVEHQEKSEGKVFSERSYGAFQRTITLPFEVDSAKVEATFDKGVLKITLPKSAELESKTTRIAVKAA